MDQKFGSYLGKTVPKSSSFSQKKRNNLSYNLEQRLEKHAMEHKKKLLSERDIWEKLFDKVSLPVLLFYFRAKCSLLKRCERIKG